MKEIIDIARGRNARPQVVDVVCNYPDNYYGDQVCIRQQPRVAAPVNQAAPVCKLR